jgi:hypothetical protein
METLTAKPAAQPRSLHEICEDARRADCTVCPAPPGDECASQPLAGYHVARFCRAFRQGLISGPDLISAL